MVVILSKISSTHHQLNGAKFVIVITQMLESAPISASVREADKNILSTKQRLPAGIAPR
jgi:hypothetical protein